MTQNNSETSRRVIIVGAGHGGGAMVGFLRQFGFSGSITLIGDEPVAPYQRPPLSKAWLKGEATLASLAIRPDSFYADQKIDLRLGTRVEAVDAEKRLVSINNGEKLPYDELILATGANARNLPIAGAQHGNVLTLRTLSDAEKLSSALGPSKRLVVIGGGYVGLECAATARSLGSEVVLIEKTPRLLERVASAPIAEFLQSYHEKHGVNFVLNASIEAIDGKQRAESVRLADGRTFPCDVVLVGVGAVPAIALAEKAGLACDNGIKVDEDCRTSNSHVYAIGDVANRPHPLFQRDLRLESVPSSNEQARRVAAAITGREPAAAEIPWFWSDQYDLKLQIAGLPFDIDELVTRGDPAIAKFAVYHLRDGRVATVEAINSPQDFMAGKKLIASGKPVAAKKIADSNITVNELIA